VQRKSSAFGCLFLSLAASVAGGCRPPAGPNAAPPAPFQGLTLRVACPDDTTAELVRTCSRPWAARQGATVEVIRSADDSPAARDADVWIIPPARLPHWAAAGKLTPLPEDWTSRDSHYAWMDLLPLYREHLLNWNRTTYGLPLLGESDVCCYRTDLFDDPAHRAAFRAKYQRDLGPPTTWEQLADLAEFFREHGPDGKASPSLPPLPADDADLDRLFYTVAANFARRAAPSDAEGSANRLDELFSFHYDLETGRPRIATPGFVHALSLLQRLQTCRPSAPQPRPQEAFLAGKAVLCLTGADWLPAFQKEPALRDRFGVCRVPGGSRYFDFRTGKPKLVTANRVPYLGGAGKLAVVPRRSPHAEAAWALLADLSGPAIGGQIAFDPRWGGGPTRDSQLRRDRWDAYDLDGPRTLALKTALQETLLHRNLKNPVLCLRTPREADHRAALLAEVRPALLKGTDPAAALERVAQRWSELDRQQGLAEHRADYRLSLGLLAR
jgi:multiple sugar transport system substrate-binding protein